MNKQPKNTEDKIDLSTENKSHLKPTPKLDITPEGSSFCTKNKQFETKGKFLEPSTSIFGSNNIKVKTIEIQQIAPQNKIMEINEGFASKPDFKKYKPFHVFSNIRKDDYFRGPTGNPFFDYIFLAYALHKELVLSPDDIWVQISSCFAQYVDRNAEDLRNRIVTHEEKKILKVFYNCTDPDFQEITSDKFRWDYILDEFSKLIKTNTIGDISNIIECNFTTTGPIELVSSQTSLMHSCEKYFDYRMGACGCGIPKVHFLGEKSDWISILDRLDKMKAFKLKDSQYMEWIGKLEKIVSKFIETYEGKADKEFWNSIVKKFDGFSYKPGPSGIGSYYYKDEFVNGWILDFFLFDAGKEYLTPYRRNVNEPAKKKTGCPWDAFEEHDKKGNPLKYDEGIKFDEIPVSMWKVPVTVDYHFGPKAGKSEAIYFISGFTAVVKESKMYRPVLSYGVSYRDENDEKKEQLLDLDDSF